MEITGPSYPPAVATGAGRHIRRECFALIRWLPPERLSTGEAVQEARKMFENALGNHENPNQHLYKFNLE